MDLVCDNQNKMPYLLSLQQFAGIFGTPISGWISDRFGRKKSLYVGLSLYFSSSLISPLLFKDYFYYGVAKFVQGLSNAWSPFYILGMVLVSFVL